MNGDIYLAGYCDVSSVWFTSDLTTGGKELYDYTEQYGWTMMNAGGTTVVCVGFQQVHHELCIRNVRQPFPSTLPGSGLVYLIQQHNLAQYNEIVCNN